MTSPPSKSTHVLFSVIPGWGHLRPCVVLACKLVRARDSIIVTIPVAGEFQTLVDKEIDRCLSSKEKNLKQNLHVVNLGGEGRDAVKLIPILLSGFELFYTSLHTLTPIKCATGRIHNFERAPDVVVADFIMLDGLHTIRNLNQCKVPVLSWHPASLGPAMRLIGPEELGGIGYIEPKAREIAEKTGRLYKEVELEIFKQEEGVVVRCPGMPPMYDYEYFPYLAEGALLEMQIVSHGNALRMLYECDGMICTSSTAVEPEACKAVKEWFAKTNRPFYIVGPLLPDSMLLEEQPGVSEAVEPTLSTNDEGVVTFLDSIYATSGSHSLIYVSFGSIFWPPGDGIWRVIEIILNRDIPLVRRPAVILQTTTSKTYSQLLAYDEERLAKMPEHIAGKFKASSKALTCVWAPQQTILRHQATGWLLTHGGQNSITEAIVRGVPMIAWPMSAEQPGNAAYMTLVLEIAYEIVEGRSGPGLRPMYRGIQPQGTSEALEKEIQVILNKAFGDDGKMKREKIRVLQGEIKAGLKVGGDSFADFERLVQDYIRV